MIWLTWRQFRTQALVVFGGLLVLAAALAATGHGLARDHRARGAAFLDGVDGTGTGLYVAGWLALLLLPALIGMFWGAPLVTRELDAGTHRLIWTMTGRTRWLAVKLGLLALAAAAAGGLLGAVMTWWAAPIDAAVAELEGRPGPGVFVVPRLHPLIFGARGVLPVGHAVFAFVLGVALGVLVRRTLPAMALLLAAVACAQIAMPLAVRPHLMAPLHTTVTISERNLRFIGTSGELKVMIDRPGAWVTSQRTVKDGRAVLVPAQVLNCPDKSRQGGLICFDRVAGQGYRQAVDYQPADRFWAFQVRETLLYLLSALALAGACAWWVRTRLES